MAASSGLGASFLTWLSYLPLSKDAWHSHTSVAFCWAQSFAGARLSNSLQFWPQLGLHAFRKISPPPFAWVLGWDASARTAHLMGTEKWEEARGEKRTTQFSLNLGKSTRVCISLKTIHRHFWLKWNHASHRGLETANEALVIHS